MKTIGRMAFVAAACAGLAQPAMAQQQVTTPVQPGETALEFAQRIDACSGGEIVSAEFLQGRTLMQATCRQPAGIDTAQAGQGAQGAQGMAGGLGAGAAAAGLGVAMFALAAGDDSTTTTTTTN